MSKKVIFVLPMLFCWLAGVALADPAEPKIVMDLKAEPTHYVGRCPATVNFKGTITLKSPGASIEPYAPIEVRYVFTRSDGAVDTRVKSVIVPIPGTRAIGTTWTLGDSVKLPVYEGWQAIKVLSPVELTSEKASFKIKCNEKTPYQKAPMNKLR